MSVLVNTVSAPQAGGRKRLRDNSSPLAIEGGDDIELLISGVSSKRTTYSYYWDGLECTSSPLTPESGITDMSSPPGAMNMDTAADSPVTRTTAMSSPGPCNVTAQGIGSIIPVQSSPAAAAALQPQQTDKGFMLRIVDQPEENYRARYDSEGCRGPMKGRSGGYPTIEVLTEQGQKWSGNVKVELVGHDGVPLQSCLLDSGDQRNVNKKLHPSEGTNKASFENLRIRRLKKQDTKSSRSAQNDGHATKGSNRKTKQDEKIAYLLFTADIKTEHNGSIVLRVKSEQIYLNANHDPPEIHRIIPAYGTAHGGEQIVIVGTRMHTARVSFFVTTSEGIEQEFNPEIDREISHQNALVISTPTIPPHFMNSGNEYTQARVVVTAGKGDRGGKEPLRSNNQMFTYIKHDTCKECFMKKMNNRGISPMHMCGYNHPGMYTSHSSLIGQPTTMLRQHLVPQQSIYTSAVKSCPSPRSMMINNRPAGCASPPTNDFPPVPVSIAPSDSHLRMLSRPSHSPPPPLPNTSQGVLESLFQDPLITSSPPLSANSTHSLDIPATLSPSAHQVSHLEPSITEVMPFTLSDPSGPVSPEEMSQYLNCSDFPLAPSQEFTHNSTSAFVTDPLHVSRRQQSTNNM